MPKLFYQGELTLIIYVIAMIGGQIGFYLFDRVYFSLMTYYRRVIRRHLKMD